MSVTQCYDVDCNVCEKEFYSRMGGDGVYDMSTVERGGWLVLYDSDGQNPHAAICPDCWQQIATCYAKKEAASVPTA